MVDKQLLVPRAEGFSFIFRSLSRNQTESGCCFNPRVWDPDVGKLRQDKIPDMVQPHHGLDSTIFKHMFLSGFVSRKGHGLHTLTEKREFNKI